jgi:transcriptional regulator of arginine metabolism
MSKTFRQGQILDIIRKKEIYTQEELREELGKRDIHVSQETLSRDLKDMRLVKTARGYMEPPQEIAPEPLFSRMAEEFLRDVRVAQNIVILKTGPGHASTVAIALDEEDWPEVVGTIAGDDTVVVISPDNAGALALHNKLMEFLLDKSAEKSVPERA